jgi:ABC-type uncharacterized transport system involved in gliding motility auxiliary subunit
MFGTSRFVTDSLFEGFAAVFGLNGNLFLNAMNWLTAEEDLISIRATPPDERPMSPPSNPLLLLLTTAVLVPLAVLGVGMWIWWRRR